MKNNTTSTTALYLVILIIVGIPFLSFLGKKPTQHHPNKQTIITPCVTPQKTVTIKYLSENFYQKNDSTKIKVDKKSDQNNNNYNIDKKQPSEKEKIFQEWLKDRKSRRYVYDQETQPWSFYLIKAKNNN